LKSYLAIKVLLMFICQSSRADPTVKRIGAGIFCENGTDLKAIIQDDRINRVGFVDFSALQSSDRA